MTFTIKTICQTKGLQNGNFVKNVFLQKKKKTFPSVGKWRSTTTKATNPKKSPFQKSEQYCCVEIVCVNCIVWLPCPMLFKEMHGFVCQGGWGFFSVTTNYVTY